MIPYLIVVGEKSTYFLHNCYKFIENDKIEERSLLNIRDGSLDPYDYPVEKCGIDALRKL